MILNWVGTIFCLSLCWPICLLYSESDDDLVSVQWKVVVRVIGEGAAGRFGDGGEENSVKVVDGCRSGAQ